ncbi:MAG: penicillin acylase family protein [Caldilineales bacterium]
MGALPDGRRDSTDLQPGAGLDRCGQQRRGGRRLSALSVGGPGGLGAGDPHRRVAPVAGYLHRGRSLRFQRDAGQRPRAPFRQTSAEDPANQHCEAAVLDLLRAWDCKIDADSAAASIYHVCQLNALHTIFDRHLDAHSDAYIGIDITGLGDFSMYQGRTTVRLLDMLDDPRDVIWLRDPETGIPEAKTEALHRALRITLQQMIAAYGPDMDKWTWGRLHRVEFAHVAGAVKPLNLLFNRGPYPMGGDNDTLLRATTRPEFPFKAVGAIDALRFVADVSDWDRCQIMVAGGQSGHVASTTTT